MSGPLSNLYKHSLSLVTDLYQLTMAYSHWKTGSASKEAVFHVFFRKNPFQGGFAVACGLNYVIDYVSNVSFEPDDLAYLATLLGSDGKPLFDKEFLDYLSNLKLEVNIDAVPEGTLVFAHEPILRVEGPIIHCQLLETILLNIINFQTLVATKAARVKIATGGQPVLEFGLRRAQGIDGSLSASWASYVGGVDASSNVLAGKLFGIPVKGTHAHSWVMSHEDERDAFKNYAEAMPNNCVFLVDTYDTLEGVRHAIEIGKWLREAGHELQGIRLDSGDLSYLSIEARKLLDAGGFPNATIFASNDLDERIISSLNDQGAEIDVWGVGTKLVTAYDQPALGGVYKLAAVREPGEKWEYRVKVSEQAIKTSTPGVQQIRRFFDDSGTFLADMIYDLARPPQGSQTIVDPVDYTRRKVIPKRTPHQDLLVPIFKKGKLVYNCPPLDAIKQYATEQLSCLHPSTKRMLNPHQYPVGLEYSLNQLKVDLVLKDRESRQREDVDVAS